MNTTSEQFYSYFNISQVFAQSQYVEALIIGYVCLFTKHCNFGKYRVNADTYVLNTAKVYLETMQSCVSSALSDNLILDIC